MSEAQGYGSFIDGVELDSWDTGLGLKHPDCKKAIIHVRDNVSVATGDKQPEIVLAEAIGLTNPSQGIKTALARYVAFDAEFGVLQLTRNAMASRVIQELKA